MFADKQNIIPHFEKICSVDQGTNVNSKVWACKSIVEKLMTEEPVMGSYTIDVDPMSEAPILRGAEINLGLDAEDFWLVVCLDLHSLTVSHYGRGELIDYLAEITCEYYWYAQKVIAESKKKPRRRSRKTA